MATNSRRLVRFSILGIAGTIAFASVANADPVGVALVESSNSASVAFLWRCRCVRPLRAGNGIRVQPRVGIIVYQARRVAAGGRQDSCWGKSRRHWQVETGPGHRGADRLTIAGVGPMFSSGRDQDVSVT